MSTSKTSTQAFPGSKTSNTKATLEILRDVAKIGEAMPYLEGIAGILKTIVDMKQEFTESKEEWEKTMNGIRDLQKVLEGQARDIGDQTLVIPEYLKVATAALESCVERIIKASEKVDSMKRHKRLYHRKELKADAVTCSTEVDRALQLFQTTVAFKMAIQVNDLHASGCHTSSVQVILPVCPSPSDLFTGRAALLKHLDELLTSAGRRIVTIVAKGGSGKTQLTLKYVEEQKSRFSHIFFVDASSAETISSAFGLIGKAGGMGGSVEDARNWFAGNNEKWLLILDNADDVKLDLGQYLPRSSHGKIIITSRNHEVSQLASVFPDCSIHLPDLNESDAVDLLLKSARLDSRSDTYCTSASDIVKELGCMALAVSHAGAYISQSCQLQSYLTLFHEQSAYLLKYDKTQSIDGYSYTVFSTLDLSYQKLSDTAKALLHVVSFFHHINIPLQIFSQAAEHVFAEEPILSIKLFPKIVSYVQRLKTRRHVQVSSSDLLKEFLSPYWDTSQKQWLSVTFLETIRELQNHSMISFNISAQNLSLHSIVHMWARHIVPVQEIVYATALEILSYGTPKTKNYSLEETRLLVELAPHAKYLYDDEKMQLPELVAKNIPIKQAVASIFDYAGFWQKELFVYKEILQLQYQNHNTPEIVMQQTKQKLAETYRRLGEYKEAEKLQQEVLKCYQQILGEQHPDTWHTMANLAITYSTLGRYTEAEKLEREVLKWRKQILGKQHPDTWQAKANLTVTYHNLCQFNKAKKLGEKVLEWRKQSLGEQHPDTWTAMAYLGSAYNGLNQYTEAAKLEEEVVKWRKQILGEQHPDTWYAIGALASTYSKSRQFTKAEKLEYEALQWHKKILGEQHPDTWQAKANLAATYDNLEQYTESEKLRQEVLEWRKQFLGEDHPATWRGMANLATTYSRLELYIKAEKLQQEVLKWRKQILGMQHLETWRAMAILATTYCQLSQYTEAENLRQEILKWCIYVLENQHPETCITMVILYQQLGQCAESERLQQEILKWHKKMLGEQLPDAWNTIKHLAALYRHHGLCIEAEKVEQEMLKWRN